MLAACGGANDFSTEASVVTASLSEPSGLVLSCTGCHSDTPGAIVSLTAYSEDMLKDALERYRSEAEGTTVMHRLARGYTDEEIASISAYLGQPEDDG
ncbi:MAG: hypothetical protein AAGL11_01155 [Pseudomonadota bacterium]